MTTMSVISEFAEVRKRLDSLGYFQPLLPECLSLVQALLTDLEKVHRHRGLFENQPNFNQAREKVFQSAVPAGGYQNVDKILTLEKNVENLKMLNSQQSLAIKKLEMDSLEKSKKIIHLQNVSGKASITTASDKILRPKMHLSSHIASARYTGPTVTKPRSQNPQTLDLLKLAENKIQQLLLDKDFLKKRISIAETQICKMQKHSEIVDHEKVEPLKEMGSNNAPESLYLKSLLKENLELKHKLAKLPKQKYVQIVSDDPKEPFESARFDPKQNQPVVNSKENVHPGANNDIQTARNLQHLSEHNKCLQHQVCKLKNELTLKANQIACCCQPANQGSSCPPANQRPMCQPTNQRPVNCPPQNHPRPGNFQKSKCPPGSRNPKPGCRPVANQKSMGCHPTYPANNRKTSHQNHQMRCDQCAHVCTSESQVRFEDEVDPSSIHLCEHIKCLQRQICHLKMRSDSLEKQNSKIDKIEEKLKDFESENCRLSDKCDKLLDQKKEYLEKISALNRQIDGMLSKNDDNVRIRCLIDNIEGQRDMYKTHVNQLIKDLQNKKERADIQVIPEPKSSTSRLPPTPSPTTDVASGPDMSHQNQAKQQKTVAFQNENIDEIKAKLKDTRDALKTTQTEVLALRKQLWEVLDLVENQQKKKTKTLPKDVPMQSFGERQPPEIPSQAFNERPSANQHKSNSSPDLLGPNINKSTGTPPINPSHAECDKEIGRLKGKVEYLERQLLQTENALQNAQRLVADGGNKSYEMNSQLVQMKQEINNARREIDDLRLRLDKKDELVARIIEDKNELLTRLDEQTEKAASLQTKVSQKSASLASVDLSNASLEKKFSDSLIEVQQQRRKAREAKDDAELLRVEVEKLEDQNRKLRVESSNLRLEMDGLRQDMGKMAEDGRSSSEEVLDLRDQIQGYVNEVKKIEEVLQLKEMDRRTLLNQYQELTKEVTAAETSNRTLEMQAANLMIELRSREADVVAASSRCENLDKYLEEVLQQNEQFRAQVVNLNAKVDMLTSDLKENRIHRDSVLTDLNDVNHLAVKLNTDKVDLLNKISGQNNDVEKLQVELTTIREDLLSAMGALEEERHRARTLQDMIVSTEVRESRETVIRTLEEEAKQEDLDSIGKPGQNHG